MAEEVAQREAVDAFAGEGAGVALVLEPEAARDAGDGFGGLKYRLIVDTA